MKDESNMNYFIGDEDRMRQNHFVLGYYCISDKRCRSAAAFLFAGFARTWRLSECIFIKEGFYQIIAIISR